jgi:hypothetical protein
MVRRDESTRMARVLLVTDDENFSSTMKSSLPGVEMLSVTQDSVWLAIRAGLDVTRGISTLVIDSTVSGLQQLRLYERMRPPDVVSHVPIVFTRAAFAGPGGPAHELDFYHAPESTVDEAVRLVAHVLGVPLMPAGVAARLGTPMAEAVARRRDHAPVGPALPSGLLQRLGLWGLAAALLGFSFWPIVGSTPFKQAVEAPFAALSESSDLAAARQAGR